MLAGQAQRLGEQPNGTKTSLPSKRNSAGRRTAWLRPWRNNFAVCPIPTLVNLKNPKPLYTIIYQGIRSISPCKVSDPPRLRCHLEHGASPSQSITSY